MNGPSNIVLKNRHFGTEFGSPMNQNYTVRFVGGPGEERKRERTGIKKISQRKKIRITEALR